MQIITFHDLKLFAEREAGIPLNVDMFWGTKEIKVYPPDMEYVDFRLFRNLRRTSFKGKYHKKDNGHTLHNDMVRRLVHHFQKLKVFPLGAVKVIP